MASQKSSPIDARVIIAVVIFFVFYFGWQNHLAKKYPGYNSKPSVTKTNDNTAVVNETPKNPSESTNPTNTPTAASPEPKKTEVPIEEKLFSYQNKNIEFQVSNRGMGISNFKILRYTDKDKSPIILSESVNQKLFELRSGPNRDLVVFEIEDQGNGHYVGRTQIGDMKIERDLKFLPESSSFENTVKIMNAGKSSVSSLSFYIPDRIHTPESTSFLFPSFERQDFYIAHSGTSERINLNHAKEDVNKDYKLASILSLETQYFSSAILDQSEISPEASVHATLSTKNAIAELTYQMPVSQPELLIKQVLYAGPKSIDNLKKIDPRMAQLFDFGWMEWIAVPLLYTMKWMYSMIPNWGIAIILLTLFVRFLVLPFNVMSVRSMKAMQKIQPQINSLRERYKSDPLKLNQEMMALMKANKANPLGGCLPMLIQIPIFFALYRVIGSSIELYQSPFGLWITDLSSHDRFYVLPILMGITMFVQQKVTPTTMDPTQAKILAFMPLIFTVFMLQLPSGLTLYMFVSALFGITQQWIMLRQKAS